MLFGEAGEEVRGLKPGRGGASEDDPFVLVSVVAVDVVFVDFVTVIETVGSERLTGGFLVEAEPLPLCDMGTCAPH